MEQCHWCCMHCNSKHPTQTFSLTQPPNRFVCLCLSLFLCLYLSLCLSVYFSPFSASLSLLLSLSSPPLPLPLSLRFQMKIRHMPVIQDNSVVGIVTMSDLSDAEFNNVLHGGKKGYISNVIGRKGLPRGEFVLCCLVMSCVILCCLVLSCVVLSCVVLSCVVLSCLVLCCVIMSCVMLCCLVVCCLVLSIWTPPPDTI
jgi:hypothetical protein